LISGDKFSMWSVGRRHSQQICSPCNKFAYYFTRPDIQHLERKRVHGNR